jgi:tetraacyldisaccharide 4'-kinase
MSFKKRFQPLYFKAVDPSETGILLTIIRLLLWPVALCYGFAIRLRNLAYDRGWISPNCYNVPVISTGNITTGGTGKTPFTAWIARLLQTNGLHPAILSRGYGADSKTGIDDENQMLRDELPDVPIIINADRSAAAKEAIERGGAEVMLMDDGFQHRRLARDLDILLIDATFPFGGGHLLPRGLLREPLSELRRADIFVITRSDLTDAHRIDEICSQLNAIAPDKPVVKARHRPVSLQTLSAREADSTVNNISLAILADGSWAGFCSIGNPFAFKETLVRLCDSLPVFEAFPDHHHYNDEEIEEIRQKALRHRCRGVVTTTKDATKMRRLSQLIAPIPVYALKVEMTIIEDRGRLLACIESATGRQLTPSN